MKLKKVIFEGVDFPDHEAYDKLFQFITAAQALDEFILSDKITHKMALVMKVMEVADYKRILNALYSKTTELILT